MPDREVLPIVVDIECDELAARQQTFLEKFLQIEATREQHIIGIDSVARSFERERCCGGRAGPQVPASSQARPLFEKPVDRVMCSLCADKLHVAASV